MGIGSVASQEMVESQQSSMAEHVRTHAFFLSLSEQALCLGEGQESGKHIGASYKKWDTGDKMALGVCFVSSLISEGLVGWSRHQDNKS